MSDDRRIVLVVEDEEYLREGILRLLEEHGWRALGARDGVEAIEIFRAEPVEVVLTDLLMPRMDGVRLMAALREIDPDLPLVVLTGFGSVDRCVEALRAGASDFLAKPVENEELLETLEKAWRVRVRNAPPEPVLAATSGRLRLEIPAEIDLLAGAVGEMKAVAQALGYGHRRRVIRRALEEALGNAILHGAGAGSGEHVAVEARFEADRLVLRVEDPGKGFRPAEAADAPPSAGKGRGIFLIRSFADEARWIPPGNVVEMTFYRRGKPASPHM